MPHTAPTNVVKKNTVILCSLAALAIGFIGGVIYSAYNTPPVPMADQQPSSPGQPMTDEGISAEKAAHILEVEQEVAANPGNVEALIHLGNDYFEVKEYDKAITTYNSALEISPDNTDVLTDLGVMYRRTGQYDKAMASFDRAIAIDPQQEPARFNKGVVLVADLNDPAAAIRIWEELLQINPLAQAPNGQAVKDIIEEVRAEMNKGEQ